MVLNMMSVEEKRKLFQDVFAPKKYERVLILIDEPHDEILDTTQWKERREMANDWFYVLNQMSEESGFSVEKAFFPATGINNKQLSYEIKNMIGTYNLVIAMTEFSVTSSLVLICNKNKSSFRSASMPGVERRMEDTSLRADYPKVRQYALGLKRILNNVVGAEIDFSNQDHLSLDLRNRNPLADLGDCTLPGQTINLPSGETCIAPYEASQEEKEVFGQSKTNGLLPVYYGDEFVRYQIQENSITKILGNGKKAASMKVFFNERKCRRNIAELGIGCNPNAIVTGNVLEDEKVPGLHIAYGMSAHIGGKISCDTHQDICYPKDAPVEAESLILIHDDDRKTELISKGGLHFELIS